MPGRPGRRRGAGTARYSVRGACLLLRVYDALSQLERLVAALARRRSTWCAEARELGDGVEVIAVLAYRVEQDVRVFNAPSLACLSSMNRASAADADVGERAARVSLAGLVCFVVDGKRDGIVDVRGDHVHEGRDAGGRGRNLEDVYVAFEHDVHGHLGWFAACRRVQDGQRVPSNLVWRPVWL